MGSLKSLSQGFLVATGLIWIFNAAALMLGGDAWLGFIYLLILFIPTSSIVILELKKINPSTIDVSQKWRNLLFSFQGVALGFWMFDILTTVYAINVTGLAIELNPLGWPWGILGALVFFGPTLVFSYVLLFRIKEKISMYAALPIDHVNDRNGNDESDRGCPKLSSVRRHRLLGKCLTFWLVGGDCYGKFCCSVSVEADGSSTKKWFRHKKVIVP